MKNKFLKKHTTNIWILKKATYGVTRNIFKKITNMVVFLTYKRSFMKRKKCLLINDMPSYGKVALSAMIPVLTKKDIDVHGLPTAIISNPLNYGKYEILDTTQYMQNTLKVWTSLDFKFDAICTGFIANDSQVDIILDYVNYCKNTYNKPPIVMTDPIMGDMGRLYNGVDSSGVKRMKKLCSISDIIVPNLTEAVYLTNFQEKYPNEEAYNGLTKKDYEEIIIKLKAMGAKSIIITSAKINGSECVIGYDNILNNSFIISYELINKRLGGTGDIFSAILISDLLNNKSLMEAADNAVKTLSQLIMLNTDKEKNDNWIEIEKFIDKL